ncbi:MAG: lipopolysaccharide biosynthesis protein [Gammaproteobacteria bacterium]
MSIGKEVSSSIRWMAGMRVISQIFTWVATLIVIRLLSPEDYGLMALAAVVIGLLDILDDMGLASALVKKKELTDKFVRQIFGMLFIFNTGFYIALYVTAPFVADFFDDQRLSIIIQILGLQTLIRIFFYVPNAMMRRDMDFRSVSLIRFVAVVGQSLSILVLAYLGFGVWSLVYGSLVYTAVQTLGAMIVSSYLRMPSLSFEGIGEALSFGGMITIHRILYYIYNSADAVVMGKITGQKALGFYSVAMQIACLPMDKFMMILNEVGFSAFSTIQDNQQKMNELLRKAVRILGIVVFPVFMGMSCTAPELVAVLLGEKWAEVALPLQIVSAVMALKMMNITDPLLFAMGRPDVGVKALAIGCVIMPIAFYIGAVWGGLVGVSLSWLIAYPPYFYISMKIVLATIGMKFSTYISEFAYPALFSGIMYVMVMLARELISPMIGNTVIELVMLIFVGAVTYTGLVLAFQRDTVMQLYSMVRS